MLSFVFQPIGDILRSLVVKHEVGRDTDIFHNRPSKVSEQRFHVLKMASDSDEDEFPGFEVRVVQYTPSVTGRQTVFDP